ncbi:MAG: rhomboid family intramembrane serine protease [Saprospiraceae bacterium]
MIFPIGDDQVQGGYKPIFSYGFIGLNILIFLFQYTTPSAFICEFGSIPNDIVRGENYYTLLTSMFMHGGVMHLVGNMLFLWVFADNIEASVGNINFLVFYLLGGLAASLAHIYFSTTMGAELTNACCEVCSSSIPCTTSNPTPCPGSIPTVGASGAIAAVMGAYLVMFPKSRIKVLVLILFRTFRIPAIFFLGLWIGQQLLSGFAAIGPQAASSGVAWWAHIGGFAFGVFAGFFARHGGDHLNPPELPTKHYDDGNFV